MDLLSTMRIIKSRHYALQGGTKNQESTIIISDSRQAGMTSLIFAFYILIFAFLSGCGSTVRAESTGFIESADLDPAIPSPKSVLGYDVGAKAVRYSPLENYLQTLAETSNRVKLTIYGQSHEGRSLYYLTITSPANHKRLDLCLDTGASYPDLPSRQPLGIG